MLHIHSHDSANKHDKHDSARPGARVYFGYSHSHVTWFHIENSNGTTRLASGSLLVPLEIPGKHRQGLTSTGFTLLYRQNFIRV